MFVFHKPDLLVGCEHLWLFSLFFCLLATGILEYLFASTLFIRLFSIVLSFRLLCYFSPLLKSSLFVCFLVYFFQTNHSSFWVLLRWIMSLFFFAFFAFVSLIWPIQSRLLLLLSQKFRVIEIEFVFFRKFNRNFPIFHLLTFTSFLRLWLSRLILKFQIYINLI